MDKNIIPAIVPPISIEKELNKTPLISKQAQYINSDKFVSTFLKDLVRKGVVEHGNPITDKVALDYTTAIRKEIGIIREDSYGFYIARLIDKYKRPNVRGAFWKVSGLLGGETDSNIVEHWIYMDAVNFEIGSKLKFKINRLVEQGNNHKAFSLKNWYELH